MVREVQLGKRRGAEGSAGARFGTCSPASWPSFVELCFPDLGDKCQERYGQTLSQSALSRNKEQQSSRTEATQSGLTRGLQRPSPEVSRTREGGGTTLAAGLAGSRARSEDDLKLLHLKGPNSIVYLAISLFPSAPFPHSPEGQGFSFFRF